MTTKDKQEPTSGRQPASAVPPATMTTVRDGAPGDRGVAAAQAVSDAARNAEIESLRKERDELRERLSEAGPDELALLRAETDALRNAAARVAPGSAPGAVSEGVRQDLQIHGYAVDPATGAALVLDRESGEVTATSRTGQASKFKLRPPAPVAPDIEREPKA